MCKSRLGYECAVLDGCGQHSPAGGSKFICSLFVCTHPFPACSRNPLADPLKRVSQHHLHPVAGLMAAASGVITQRRLKTALLTLETDLFLFRWTVKGPPNQISQLKY